MSSGLEASIAGAETHMLGELSYALPASAQYMKKREEIYWTSGANVYAANGIRTMRVNISGQGFLDMSSLVLECDVDNLSTAAPLKPLVPGLEGFFQSLKVSLSGTTCEEIGDPSCSYGRIFSMLSRGLPKEKIAMNGAMGFELEPHATDYRAAPTPETIPASSSKKILHKPLAGICNQKVFLPLWAISSSGQGLSLEFQIIQDATAPVNTTNGSSLWQLSNVRIYGDVLHCDESLQNTYARHLLNGKNLTIPMRSYTSLSFSQPSGGANATLMIPRTLSRVNAIFLVGRKATQETATSKEVNRFCYPGGNATQMLQNHKTLQAWLQIGSSRFPSAGQYEGVNMFYYKWLSALGIVNSGHHTTQTTMADYKTDSFIVCWDLETIASTSFSGSSLAGGSVSINLKGFGQTDGDAPDRWDCILFHDALISIHDGFTEISV